ncbi:MAG TPA: hypothetical protein VEW48_22900 [Thermoanaerobaculia bacterium]|nr:hypothetical protein [Thermoanaerobaculia bacterium]
MKEKLGLVLGLALLAGPALAAVDPSLLAGMKARAIGPAAMSGRIAVVEGWARDPNLVWIGSASGGVWKSVNGGLTWEPVFDDQPVASIGALAIDPNNSDVVWVGTGESNPRNSVSVGEGVFKTLDGGKTWQRLGLEKTERVSRILLHPSDPRVAWVAAMGQAWGESSERGVYKTEDGGKTWRRVLYVDERTGAADLTIDPSNPNKLFAALWDYRRWPWFFRSGGPGSGLFVTYDGGETWKRMTESDGLPKGDLGRIGVAISRSDPRIVYALVEAEKNALLRSTDGGATWKPANTEASVSPRPFYYADLRIDPADPNRVYRLQTTLDVSTDAGKSFSTLAGFRTVHPDNHAMWIDPNHPNRIIEGNDGGVFSSDDRGANWRFAGNLPVGQLYHVRVDMERPYNVYGGMQDNGSWKGPNTVWESGGIRNHHWSEVGFGDGFDTAPDPRDPMRGYSMSQEGFLLRWDLRTGERKDIRPAPPEGKELRFNWNAGFALDPFDPDTLYFGSQYVHKSTDRGDTWTLLSGDLTTNKPEWQKQKESGGLTVDASGAENFTTVIALAVSPVERGVLWAGTDDGRLHVTRDGGKTWTSVEKNVRGVPDNTWIPHVEPSPHDAGTAFVVFDNHRRSDLNPYVYKTTDYGRTWTSLATKNLRGYALKVVQDPKDPDLLFLGTEFGLWVSLDGGKEWMHWKHGVPTVSVMDMIIHPREEDLVLATHGRAFFVLDDIRPLRELTEEVQKQPVHLFPIPDAQQYRVAQGAGERFPGNGEFRGESRPYGALITFSLNAPGLPHPDAGTERERKEKEAREKAGAPPKEKTPVTAQPQGGKPLEGMPPPEEQAAADEDAGGRKKGPQAKIEVLDDSGAVIRSLDAPVKLGVNRAAWDLRSDAPKRIPRKRDDEGFSELRSNRGPEVLPGTYKVRVSYAGQTAEGRVQVLGDPRFKVTREEREANVAALRRANKLLDTVADAVARIQRTRRDVDAVTAQLRRDQADAKKQGGADDPARKAVLDAARDLQRKLGDLERRFWATEDVKGLVEDADLEQRIGSVSRSVSSSWDAPSPAQLAYLDRVEKEARQAVDDLNRFFAEDVAAFRTKVEAAKFQLLPQWDPLKMPG